MEKINNALCNINAKELEELIEKYKCSNDSSLSFLEIINPLSLVIISNIDGKLQFDDI